ncbi:MAG: trans-sulfuration enzyme family protein [Pyrinomonadaceae bacterium]
MKKLSIFTRVVHADRSEGEPSVSVPIYNASVFALPDIEMGAKIHNFQAPGFFYGRLGNPTQAALEKTIANLEHAEAALAFGSGMAAISAVLFAFLSAGDHIVAPASMYSATTNLLKYLSSHFGIEVTFVDAEDAINYANAVRNETKLVWIETPSNPLLQITDITAVAQIARECGAVSVIDNTFASPFNQNPLQMGADIVMHSATKYLGGHSDLSAGVLAGNQELMNAVFDSSVKLNGGALSPQTAWLLMRGIKTLALRMKQHNSNAYAIANMLVYDSRVKTVYYPGLDTHRNFEIAKKQMIGFGGMLSVDFGDYESAVKFANSLEIFSVATSLGGVESLVQHSAGMTHAAIAREERIAAGVTDGLLRLSIGIEDEADLLADIAQALNKL